MATKRTVTRRGPSLTGDAISLLKKDHSELMKMLKKLENTTERSGKQRTELLQQIEAEVKAHTKIEEEIFYPAFRESVRSKSDQELYFEALEEHHVVDLVLPEIQGVSVESEVFAAKAKVLLDLIEHHIEEEEGEMFPKARRVLNASELRGLGEQMIGMKRQLLGERSSGRRRKSNMVEGWLNRLGNGKKGKRAA